MALGKKTGGRIKGSVNKSTGKLVERLRTWGCDPFQVLADIARGELLCGVCRGEGKTRFQPHGARRPGIRPCQSCWGSGKERISPSERGKAAAELAGYIEAKRKAVEHSMEDGTLQGLADILRARRAKREIS